MVRLFVGGSCSSLGTRFRQPRRLSYGGNWTTLRLRGVIETVKSLRGTVSFYGAHRSLRSDTAQIHMASIKMRLLVPLLILMCVASSEAADRPGRLPSEVRSALAPGLKVTYSPAAGSSDKSDTGTTRLATLYVQEGKAATPFLPAGPFKATLSGYFKLKLRGEYQFHLQGNGAAKLSFNDQVVFDLPDGDLAAAKPVTVAMVKGYNKIVIEYSSPAKGDAALRVHWTGDEFAEEPLPPQTLFYVSNEADVAHGTSFRLGRHLVAQHNCLKCHAGPDGVELLSEKQMPELGRDAPSLAGVGDRLDENWMARWILDPASVRNKTTMPKLISEPDQAASIAAYLASLSDGIELAKPNDDLVDAGEILFEDRGCIACHRFTDVVDEDDEHDRVSLHNVSSKFRAGALAAFLHNSRKHYAWSRMPKFNFSAEESASLEAFLRRESKGKPKELPAGDVVLGKELFAKVGCAQCHQTDTTQALAKATGGSLFGKSATTGCLAAETQPNIPSYPLDESQREAIIAFLGTDGSSLSRHVDSEVSRRQVKTIGCTACHQRDDTDAVLPYVLLDEGTQGHPPELLPPLTWAGEKLRPDWTSKLFADKLGYRAREHFKTRMPGFPTRGEWLSPGMSAEHGHGTGTGFVPKFDPAAAKTGEQIAAMKEGFACNRCHAIANTAPIAPFEARSTNLTYAASRLRHGFYLRWMADPQRIDPVTRMIKFAPDGKRTGLVQYYDGDAHKQFQALWHFLDQLDQDGFKE